MVTHMKTTVEISDALLERAKKQAVREGTTLRALLEAGLQQVLRERNRPRKFHMRDARFSGRGTQPGFQEGDWDRVRETIYEGHGA